MPPAAGVGQLLNSAQDSAAAERCAGNLWKLTIADPDRTYEELRRCVDFLVTFGQKSAYVERCMRFFGAFAAKTPANNESAAAVVEELLSHLAGHLSALDKTVRYRSAQLLQQLLAGAPASLLLEDSVAELLRESLQERLHDKQPAVRGEACRAVSHLVSEDEGGQAIVASMLQLLDTDKSKDVRIAVVQSLPLDAASLPVLLERTRDVNPLVRKALVLRLKGLPMKLLSIKQRAEVIQQLLQDRDAAVADAGAKLLARWLAQDCGGDPLQLLQLLDVETYTEAAALAVESLINSGSIGGSSGVIGYVDAATHGPAAAQQAGALVSLRALAELQQQQGQQGQLLSPYAALMWRCLCEWLRTDAISKGLAAAATGGARAAVQAAVAAERHEVLERALPESADQLLGLVMHHAAAGPGARFAAAQLMMIAATCVEWTDAASRNIAGPYLQQLIGFDPQSEAEQEDVAMSDADEAADAAAGLQLAGNGGEGLFEAAVTQLVLAVQGAGAGFTVAMLDGTAPLAAAAGLLAKPGNEAGAAAGAAVTVCVAEPSLVLQWLAYIKLLLQQLPSGRPVPDEGAAISFDSLWATLLLLALKQEQPEIRAEAVECIGLYAMAGASRPWLVTSAVQLLGPLLLADSCYATKRAAVRALTDLALLLRPAAVDAVLRGPGAAAAATATAAAGQEAEVAADSCAVAAAAAADGLSAGLSRGLLELLLEQAEVLLAEAQAPATKPKRGGRATSASKAAEAAPLPAATAELLAAVAESLCKLLLHQRAWLRYYEHYTAAAAPAAASSSEADPAATPPPAAAAIAAASTVPFPPDSRQQQARLLRRALGLLLQLQFHPATEAAMELRQCLSVFFDVFTAASGEFRLQLVAAVLPAARQALHVVCKKNPAALLVKYVLQLLQATESGDSEQQQQMPAGAASSLLGDTYDSLALQLLGEVGAGAPLIAAKVQPAKFKPYLSAVLKVVCELPLHPSQPNFECMQRLADRLALAISDATLKKEVASVQLLLSRLLQESGSASQQQQLSAEALDRMIDQMQEMNLQELRPMPGTAAAVDEALVTPSAPRTTRKAAAGGSRPGTTSAAAAAPRTAQRHPAGRSTKAAALSSSEGEDEEDEATESSVTENEDEGGSECGEESSRGPAEDAAIQKAAAALPAGGKGGVSAAAAALASAGSRRSSAAARQPLAPTTVDNSQQ